MRKVINHKPFVKGTQVEPHAFSRRFVFFRIQLNIADEKKVVWSLHQNIFFSFHFDTVPVITRWNNFLPVFWTVINWFYNSRTLQHTNWVTSTEEENRLKTLKEMKRHKITNKMSTSFMFPSSTGDEFTQKQTSITIVSIFCIKCTDPDLYSSCNVSASNEYQTYLQCIILFTLFISAMFSSLFHLCC